MENTFRLQFEALQSEVHNRFFELAKSAPITFFDLDTMDLDEDSDSLPNVDVVNSMGEQYYVRVLEIEEGGSIRVVEDEDHERFKTISFSDIGDLYNQISFIELIEAKLAENS